MCLLQLVIYGVGGAFQTPPAVPFGQALVRYLEYILMPGGAEVPAQLIVDLVAANQTDEVHLLAILSSLWLCYNMCAAQHGGSIEIAVCAVLCCAVLCCAVLCCAVLCFAVLCCAVLSCAEL